MANLVTTTINGINISPYSGFKNYIINGKKVVNQRGLTSTDTSYNQDRWYKSGNNWYQGIEGDNNLITGKTYTLSWVGAATAGYYIGTAANATINAQTFTSIANGSNFTLSISAGQNLWIKFTSDATGSTFNFVQLEEGTAATPFENRPYGLELSLCQRYYEKSFNDITATVVLNSTTTLTRNLKIDFKATKRISTASVGIVGSFTGWSTNPSLSRDAEGLRYEGTAANATTITKISGYVYIDAEL